MLEELCQCVSALEELCQNVSVLKELCRSVCAVEAVSECACAKLVVLEDQRVCGRGFISRQLWEQFLFQMEELLHL